MAFVLVRTERAKNGRTDQQEREVSRTKSLCFNALAFLGDCPDVAHLLRDHGIVI